MEENKEKEENKPYSLHGKGNITHKKWISTVLNPLKTGATSKYMSPSFVKLVKDPESFASKIVKNLEELEKLDLDNKEKIVLQNTLISAFKAIHGDYKKIETKTASATPVFAFFVTDDRLSAKEEVKEQSILRSKENQDTIMKYTKYLEAKLRKEIREELIVEFGIQEEVV